MSERPAKRRWFQFSLRRLLLWVVPLVALSSGIASCRLGDPLGDGPPSIAAKVITISVVALVWAIVVWEDRRAIALQKPDRIDG